MFDRQSDEQRDPLPAPHFFQQTNPTKQSGNDRGNRKSDHYQSKTGKKFTFTIILQRDDQVWNPISKDPQQVYNGKYLSYHFLIIATTDRQGNASAEDLIPFCAGAYRP